MKRSEVLPAGVSRAAIARIASLGVAVASLSSAACAPDQSVKPGAPELIAYYVVQAGPTPTKIVPDTPDCPAAVATGRRACRLRPIRWFRRMGSAATSPRATGATASVLTWTIRRGRLELRPVRQRHLGHRHLRSPARHRAAGSGRRARADGCHAGDRRQRPDSRADRLRSPTVRPRVCSCRFSQRSSSATSAPGAPACSRCRPDVPVGRCCHGRAQRRQGAGERRHDEVLGHGRAARRQSSFQDRAVRRHPAASRPVERIPGPEHRDHRVHQPGGRRRRCHDARARDRQRRRGRISVGQLNEATMIDLAGRPVARRRHRCGHARSRRHQRGG